MGLDQHRSQTEGASDLAALPDGLHATKSVTQGANVLGPFRADARSQQIIDNIHHGICTLDPEGFTTFANASMVKMLGLTLDECIGHHMLDFVALDTKHLATPFLANSGKGQRETFDVLLMHRENGAFRARAVIGPFHDERGAFCGSILSVFELNTTNHNEQEADVALTRLLDAQKHDSLGVLAGGIAHDFNNLLAVIIGQIEIVTANGSLDACTERALSTAISAAQRAAGLTRQLLDYAGRSQLQECAIRLGEQTQALVDGIRASLPKQLQIEVEVESSGSTVLGDPERIQQSTMHLINNAIEAYGSSPGTILVRVGKVNLEAGITPPNAHPPEPVKGGSYGFVEVRDNGLGMSPATLERVFDPFFTTKASGRGLGLAACLGVVRTHGGFFTVESELHAGTVFRVYLPLAQCADNSESADTKTDDIQRKRPRKVLVVDDEPMIRTYVRSMLEIEGFSVEDAASGMDALEILRAQHTNLGGVLLDLSMPGMDGSVVLSALRTFAPDLPVIIQTGYSAEATAQRLAQWRVTGVLQKPYRAGQLLESIQSMFA